MPQLFARMMMGRPLAVLFFLGLAFAGFSSLIAQLELPVRTFIDAGMKRTRAILLIIVGSYLLGVPSAVNLNIMKNQDFVWGYALILSGVFLAIALTKYGADRLRREELVSDPDDWSLGRWWPWVISGFVTLGGTALIAWWLIKDAKPGTWYNPLDPTSVMNCLLQWFVMIGIFLALGRWLAKQTLDREEKTRT
jgi:NSS family neurotransmitter:Na+ symporter